MIPNNYRISTVELSEYEQTDSMFERRLSRLPVSASAAIYGKYKFNIYKKRTIQIDRSLGHA